MTRHVDSFHFQPFMCMEDLEKTVHTYARGDKHLIQTFTLYKLFYLIHYIHLHPEEIKTRGRGASAQLVLPKWADENEFIFFFSPRVCLRINLKTLINSTHPQQRIGVFEMYHEPFSFRVNVAPSISVSLYAIASDRSLGDIILGLIFWCQHEYDMTNMYARSNLTYAEGPLQNFLNMIYSHYTKLTQHVYSQISGTKSASPPFLRHIKTCFQEELRANDFLKHTLRYFRTWPTLQRLPPHVRDRSQTKTRNIHRLLQLKCKTPTA